MIQLLNNIYAVPVPDDLSINDEWIYMGKIMPFDKFEVLGTCTATDIDFDVEDYVEDSIYLEDYNYNGNIHSREDWWDYETKSFWLDSSDDSFRSLLTSKGILFENPYNNSECCGRCIDSLDDCIYELRREAQQNVVEKIVIIKKL